MTAADEVIAKALSEGTRMDASVVEALQALPILSIVELLQPHLTSTNDKTENIALYVLGKAALGRHATPLAINKAALITLCQFLGLKVRRYGTCDVAVEAVSNLVKEISETARALLTDGEVIAVIVHEILLHTHAQSMPLNSRRHLIDVYAVLLLGHTSAANVPLIGRHDEERQLWIRQMVSALVSVGGQRFLKIFLTTVDGERDPQLLLTAFRMHKCVVTTFPPESLAFLLDDYFDAATAYFPVQFVPPPKCTVSRADLKSALSSVLCSQVYLTDHTIPFLCSQMSRPSQSSKGDSIELLMNIYDTEAIADSGASVASQATEVLATLRAEVLKLFAIHEHNAEAHQLLQRALHCITSACKAIAANVQVEDIMLSALEPIVGGAITTIETDTGAGRIYATMINAVCQSHPRVTLTVSKLVLPLVASLFLSPSSPQHRIRRMENCFSVVGAILSAIEQHLSTSPSGMAASLVSGAWVKPSVLSSLLDGFISALNVEDAPSEFLVRVSAECVATWIAISANHTAFSWMDRKSVDSCFKMLFRKSFSTCGVDDECGQAVMTALVNVGSVCPALFIESLLFPNEENILVSHCLARRFITCLRTLTGSASRSDISLRVVSIVLGQCLDRMMRHADSEWGSRSAHDTDKTVFDIATAVCVRYPLALCGDTISDWIRHCKSIETAASFDFVSFLFLRLPVGEQEKALREVFSSRAGGMHIDPTSLGECALLTFGDKVVLNGVTKQIFASVCNEAELSHGIVTALCEDATRQESDGRAITLRCLASMVNRCQLPQATNMLIFERVKKTHNEEVLWQVCSAVVKGALSKGDAASGAPWLDALVAALAITDASDALASAFEGVLCAPKLQESVGFWEQRYFQSTVQRISSMEVQSEKHQRNAVSALCSLMSAAKPVFVQTAAASIISFLLKPEGPTQSGCDGRWLHTARLLKKMHDAFHSSSEAEEIDTRPPILSLILSSDRVLEGLLAVAECERGPMACVRSALTLLRDVALWVGTLPTDTKTTGGRTGPRREGGEALLEPLDALAARDASMGHAKSILRRTQVALKHHKRLVRKDAADCRHAWFKIAKTV